jgi:HAD superfamily hydrolase (TIGR01484 family)
MTTEKILICTDLDRTLLPNGHAEESSLARPLFRMLAARCDTTVAYVSGRHRELLLQAVTEYNIPVPDFAIGDVGSTLYHIKDNTWEPVSEWSSAIANDWQGYTHNDIAALLADLTMISLQEPEKQNTYKVSYYLSASVDRVELAGQISSRLEDAGIRASLIWSIDDLTHTGLLDILPAGATKKHAVEFLMAFSGFNKSNTLYSGDSGNDLPVITSDILSTLVANSRQDVKQQALNEIQQSGFNDTVYIAKGGFLGLNGNYAAGIIEGLVHYFPDNIAWLEKSIQTLTGQQ